MRKQKHQDHFDTRRNFLCRSTCASLGATSLVNTLAHLKLVQGSLAQTAPADYKAIVCLFLYGGNDSNNMLIPRNGTARTNYDSARPPAGVNGLVDNHPLHIPVSGTGAALTLSAPEGGFGQSTASSFGVHPSLTRVRTMFNQGDLAFVSNVGTLVQPIERSDYVNKLKPVPPQLFSHSDQQLQWQSSLPDRPFQSGWGGRTADEMLRHSVANAAGNVSMNISIAGQNSFQVGLDAASIQYSVGTGGVVGLSGYGTNYQNAVSYSTSPPTYVTTGTFGNDGITLRAVDTISKLARMQLGVQDSLYQHHLEQGYNEVMQRARDNEAILGSALSGATGAIDTAFTNAFGAGAAQPDVANQLKMVARLIQGRNDLGNSRQIFFVSMGGFDTHQNQPTDHTNLMSNLDKSLKGFRDAMVSLNIWDDTILFTNSDFTRTLQPNGNETTSGTDHGWGGHQIVMGGPVVGQRIYGEYPDLARAAGQDVDSNRGRWIPTTAVEQYTSVVAKWFMSEAGSYVSGLGDSNVSSIFPNLGRFQAVSSIPSNLGFVDFSV